MFFIFSFGKLIFKICFGHFSIKSAPFFAEISPFRSRFQKFKMEFRALIDLLYLPHQIATDFDKNWVVGKLRLRASKRRKNRQNRTRSDGVNGLLKVGRNFFFKKCTILCFFAPSLPKEKYFGKIPDIYLYFFFSWTTQIFI